MKGVVRHIILWLFVLLTSTSALGQSPVTQITGLVRDSLTHDGIAYASISLVGTDEGTLATDRGGFAITSRARFSKLRVTAMGYKPKEVEIKEGQGNVVLIDSTATGVELNELIGKTIEAMRA